MKQKIHTTMIYKLYYLLFILSPLSFAASVVIYFLANWADVRWVYAFGASVGLALLFVVLLLVTIDVAFAAAKKEGLRISLCRFIPSNLILPTMITVILFATIVTADSELRAAVLSLFM